MRSAGIWMPAVLSLGIAGLVCGTASAQKAATTTQTTSATNFEVVGVQGNTVTVKTPKGAKEVTVDDSFRFTVDGKPVSVHELQPGMKGTATITTTTTSTPVVVTEVKNGQVAKVAGNSVIVHGANGYKMFTQEDLAKRGVKIMKDGKPAELSDLKEGDKLTATIVTEHPPKVVTKREVDAGLTSPAPPPAAATAAAAPAHQAAATTESGAAPHKKKLPKTASEFPAIAVAGLAACGMALMLGVIRRRME
jgi:hypothetical protein